MCADFYGEQAFAGIFAAQRAGKPGKRGHSMRKKQAQTKAAAGSECAVNLNVKSGKVPVACLTGVISADDIGRSGMVQLVRDKCGFDFLGDEEGTP